MGSAVVRCLFICIVAAVFAVTQEEKVFDLGQLSQYQGNGELPDLSGKVIWMSGKEGAGFHVALSPDAQDEVRKTLIGCEKTDDKCYQEVREVIQSANFVIDAEIERRHFGHFLSKTFKSKGSAFTTIAMLLLSAWSFKHPEQPSIRFADHIIPDTTASSAAGLADTKTIVLSAEGKGVATLTPVPDPTRPEGTATPLITPIATATAGYTPGDLMVTMDEGLAKRLEEIIRRSTDCLDGRQFDSDANGKRAAQFGSAICGAQGAIGMATPGGPLDDLLLMNPPTLPFTAGNVANAALVVTNFVRDFAPLMNVGEGVAQGIGEVVFMMAYNTLIENLPLGDKNPIKQKLLSGTITTPPASATATTMSRCSRSTACEASCEGVGIMFQYCETSCGAVSGCRTGAGSQTSTPITTVTTKAWIPPPAETGLPTTTLTPSANPSCAMDKPAEIQWDAFAGSKYNVAAKFCQEVDALASQALSWVVDISGNNQEAKLQARTPPVTLDPYKGYIVNLDWKPNMVFDAGSCQKSCLDAFKTVANTCGHTGGEGNVMAEKGQYDAGCGTYSYHITNTAPRKGELRCNSEGDFPKHKDVHEVTVKQGLKAMCNEVLPDVMTPGHEAITRIYYSKYFDAAKLKYTVAWRKQCSPAVTEQNPKEPWGGGTIGCRQLFYQLWTDCINGGVAGTRDIGCLTYSLSPTEE
ncbi:hypothetical protein JMJ77_0008445 [Colletotrichum scovillei]|uniref:Uncharacterized protein n=1 Tax=Colletotrichum scovillei TaxID=1209932 RepID=A0A9P7RH09_9PEZI|nr:hypothetical protein JMJ77_0008445 [Colletotrichum scovillei]KAG7075438.1 hypothetical protein JMJ76_0011898 [Colletotrichum scovillei]KAG7082448.1 hypothetical protein JMJ78_0004550 [Colletotrichum scovillei]